MNRIYADFKDRADVYMVYIQEAHASDVWQLPVNEKQNVVFAQPRSMEERTGIANSCVRKLNIKFPALIDTFDNRAERAYTGWPDRLYVIDGNGRIVYKSAPGPFGFKPLEARLALSKLVGTPATPAEE